MKEDEKALHELRAHCWAYFEYHARQRTQMFNFFILTAGVFANAITFLIKESQHSVAALFSGLACIACISFTLLDLRNKTLVRSSEKALQNIEISLAKRAEFPPELMPFLSELDADKHRHVFSRRFVKHGFIVQGLNVIAAIVFLLLATYELLNSFKDVTIC